MNKELKEYIESNLKKNKVRVSLIDKIKECFIGVDDDIDYNNELKIEKSKADNNVFYEDYSFGASKNKRYKAKAMNANSLDEYINQNNEYSNFQTTLFNMIDERGLIDSDVYNKVHIDRRLFSKIRNDSNYHPSKETIILLGLSLELDEEEIEKLLDSASYSLPRNNHYDLIIRFCFMKGIYKLTEVNDLLASYNQKLFNY